MKPAVVEVINAAIEMGRQIDEHKLSIIDIEEGFNTAIETGGPYLEVALSMLLIGVQRRNASVRNIPAHPENQ